MKMNDQSLSDRDMKRLSGPGFRAFLNISLAWGLSTKEQRLLLGDISRSNIQRWKRNRDAVLNIDQLERISHLLGIFKSLWILLPTTGNGWVKRPNDHPMFKGEPPIDLMARAGVAGLREVRIYLGGQLDNENLRGERDAEHPHREVLMRDFAMAALASQTPEGPQQPLGWQVLVVDLLPAWAFGGGWADGPFIHHPGARLYLDYVVGGRVYFQGYVRKGILGWFRKEQLDKVRRMPDGWDEAFARVRAKAVDALGSEEKADGWLRAPNRALGSRQPLAMLDTEEGTQEVSNVLGRIEYGVFE